MKRRLIQRYILKLLAESNEFRSRYPVLGQAAKLGVDQQGALPTVFVYCIHFCT